MISYLYKTSGLGSSGEPPLECKLYLGHFVYHCTDPIGHRGTCLVSQIALVGYSKELVVEPEEPVRQWVLGKRLPDVVDLNAFVLTARLREQERSLISAWTRRQIDEAARFVLPNAMELRFDQYPAQIPDRQAHPLYAALRRDLLWHDRKTFAHWLACHWVALDVHRSHRFMTESYTPHVS